MKYLLGSNFMQSVRLLVWNALPWEQTIQHHSSKHSSIQVSYGRYLHFN